MADTSFFVFHPGITLLYLLAYIDDIILIGNDLTLIRTFITRLSNEFATKDLVRLSYFLSLEVTYTSDGLFLTQPKYVNDILTRAGLLESKRNTTLLSTTDHLVTTCT